MDPALLELLQCPRCGGDLRRSGAATTCPRCQVTFPDVAGIPAIFREPQKTLDEWKRETQRFAELVQASVSGMDEQLGRQDLLPLSRKRIERLRAAQAANGERLSDMFRLAGLDPGGRTKASERDFTIIEYYEQILRDWAWDQQGQSENALAADLVTATLGDDKKLGRLLVLGTGPCRLAYDLHRRFAPSLTVALDISPLLLLAAQRIMFGTGLQMWEFPADPSGWDNVCVEHHAAAPAGPPARFHLLLADAFNAPLRPGSFDTILTPWFIDIVPHDIRDTIGLIHGLLAPGGRWLNYGPLSYTKEKPHAQRYTCEELYELGGLGAFALGEPKRTVIDYMRSKAVARGKTMEVITFSARRLDPATLPDDPTRDPPAWLMLPHLPVPRWPALEGYLPEHPMLKYLAGLIDGVRTTSEMAKKMIEDHGARPDAALDGTRAMLVLLRKATRDPGPQ